MLPQGGFISLNTSLYEVVLNPSQPGLRLVDLSKYRSSAALETTIPCFYTDYHGTVMACKTIGDLQSLQSRPDSSSSSSKRSMYRRFAHLTDYSDYCKLPDPPVVALLPSGNDDPCIVIKLNEETAGDPLHAAGYIMLDYTPDDTRGAPFRVGVKHGARNDQVAIVTIQTFGQDYGEGTSDDDGVSEYGEDSTTDSPFSWVEEGEGADLDDSDDAQSQRTLVAHHNDVFYSSTDSDSDSDDYQSQRTLVAVRQRCVAPKVAGQGTPHVNTAEAVSDSNSTSTGSDSSDYETNSESNDEGDSGSEEHGENGTSAQTRHTAEHIESVSSQRQETTGLYQKDRSRHNAIDTYEQSPSVRWQWDESIFGSRSFEMYPGEWLDGIPPIV